MNRMVVKPGGFTFSNGVTLPKGTLVSAAEQATHFDEGWFYLSAHITLRF